MYVGAVYQPPKPLYQPSTLLDYIEAAVDEVTTECPMAVITLAGDFSTLDDDDVATRCTLQSIVNRQTRCGNILDRIYVNEPCYTSVRVITLSLIHI